ncbi:hypothetical protein ACLOJK_032770 [Asimina triloba]
MPKVGNVGNDPDRGQTTLINTKLWPKVNISSRRLNRPSPCCEGETMMLRVEKGEEEPIKDTLTDSLIHAEPSTSVQLIPSTVKFDFEGLVTWVKFLALMEIVKSLEQNFSYTQVDLL